MSDIPKIFTQEVDYNTTSLNLARAQKQLRRDYAVLARSPSIIFTVRTHGPFAVVQ